MNNSDKYRKLDVTTKVIIVKNEMRSSVPFWSKVRAGDVLEFTITLGSDWFKIVNLRTGDSISLGTGSAKRYMNSKNILWEYENQNS